MRTTLFFLMLAWLGAGSAGARAQESAFVYHLAEHLAAVRAEREVELGLLLNEAPEERARPAWQALADGRRPGRPALQALDFQVLAAVRRELLGERIEGDGLQELADSLDLRVVPGCFAAREEGLGEAMVVHVSQLWPATSQDALLSLWWLGPNGERQRARQEPIRASSLERGFEMYVRPPVSSGGRYHLVPELEVGLRTVSGLPVPLDCVPGLEQLTGRLRGTSPLSAGALGRTFRSRLGDLLELGVRSGSTTPLSEQLAILEGESELARPLAAESVEGLELVELGPAEAEESSGTMVLVASAPGGSALDLCTGVLGTGWSELARREGLRVVSASLPDTMRGPKPWLEVCEVLRRECDELIVVATGELALLLPGELARGEERPIDALVLFETPAVRAPAPSAVIRPTLVLEGGAEAAGEELAGPPELRWLRLSRLEPDLALRAQLPRIVGEWLDRE
jgi:hypothetical protein